MKPEIEIMDLYSFKARIKVNGKKYGARFPYDSPEDKDETIKFAEKCADNTMGRLEGEASPRHKNIPGLPELGEGVEYPVLYKVLYD